MSTFESAKLKMLTDPGDLRPDDMAALGAHDKLLAKAALALWRQAQRIEYLRQRVPVERDYQSPRRGVVRINERARRPGVVYLDDLNSKGRR